MNTCFQLNPFFEFGYSPDVSFVYISSQVLEFMLVHKFFFQKLERFAFAFIEISPFCSTVN